MNGNNNNYYNSSDCFNEIQKQKEKTLKNATKLYLIKNGYYYDWLNYNKAKYYEPQFVLDSNLCDKYEKFLNRDLQLSGFQKKCCRQIFDSRRARVGRLKKKVKDLILNYDCLWLTLTFTDSVLNCTSKQTRRVYIRRWLKSLNLPYACARIDYGDKDKNPNSKEREHYHALVQASRIDLKSYPYGIINCSRVRKTDKSLGKLTQYINKLSYHFFKKSCGCDSLIFLRKSA